MKLRIIIFLMLFLLTGCATYLPVEHDHALRVRLPEFEEEFNLVLFNLLNTAWDDSGNWRGDLQGDATVFASLLLFELGAELERSDLTDLARRTVDYEVRLIRRVWPSMEMVVGFPALVGGSIHVGDPEYARLLQLGCQGGYLLVSAGPGLLEGMLGDRVTLLGSVAHTCLRSARVLDDDSLARKGLELIREAENFRDAATGIYRSAAVKDWPQAVMVMALAEAWRVTAEDEYLQRAEAVMTAASGSLSDQQAGGYFGHPDLQTKGLSGNNNFVWALLDLYELTGRQIYVDGQPVGEPFDSAANALEGPGAPR